MMVPEPKNMEIDTLESRLGSLNINKAQCSPLKKNEERRSITYEPDWSQFKSLQPEPFFSEFLETSPPIMNAYVHDGTIFHPFPRLPTELRFQIGELARPGPQIVRLKLKKNGQGVYSTTPIPGIIQACKGNR